MSATQPTYNGVPFGQSGLKNTIPTTTGTFGAASFTGGFPNETMLPPTSGGIAPDGKDVNGILNQLSQHQVWLNAGGQYKYDATLVAAIGGYALGAVVQADDNSKSYVNTLAGNATNPNTGGANWSPWVTSSFLQTGSGAVVRTVQSKLEDVKCVFDFFTVAQIADVLSGSATLNVTTAITTALAAHRNLFFPAGTYLVSAIFIPANTNIVTSGLNTKFKQVPGTAVGTRIISIQGSNVTLGGHSLEGNIATDTNEQNHGLFIQSSSTLGNLENIFVGDIFGTNIRGDVVYFGQSVAAYTLKNVHFGHITFDNVYRNGVSCVSAQGFSIKSIVGKNIGLFDFDIESNAASGVCINGYIGYCKGRTVGFIGTTGTDYIDQIVADTLDLYYSASNSTPAYPPQGNSTDAVVVRNNKYIRINKLKAVGFARFAVAQVSGDPTLIGAIDIGSAELINCSSVDVTANSYINAANVTVGYLEVDMSANTGVKSIFYNFPNPIVQRARLTMQTNFNVFRASPFSSISYCTLVNSVGIIFNGSPNSTVKNSTFTCDRITSNSDNCNLENLTATATTNLFVTGDNHAVVNCVLNSTTYKNGVTGVTTPYLSPMRFGGNYLWMDTTGRWRVKAAAPSSDTDGFIFGSRLQGSTTYDPPSVAAGASTSTTVTVTSAALGDSVSASFSLPLGGLLMFAEVTATSTVTVRLYNPTGAPIDIASGTLTAKVV